MQDFGLRIWGRVLKHREQKEEKTQDEVLKDYPKLTTAQKKAIKDKVNKKG